MSNKVLNKVSKLFCGGIELNVKEFLDEKSCSLFVVTDKFFNKKLHEHFHYLKRSFLYYKNLNLYQFNTDHKIDNELMLKNEFTFVVENEEIVELINYLDTQPNMIITGGYISTMYFQKNFDKESDIDIYIFGENVLENFKNFLSFLDTTYNIDFVELLGSSVITFILKKLNRKVQIILSGFESILEIMLSFDCTHNRCAYYLTDTYVTFDCKYSKTYQKTYYFNRIRPSRYKKSLKYELKVVNDVEIEDIDDTVKSDVHKWENGNNDFLGELKISKFISSYFGGYKSIRKNKYLDITQIDHSKIVCNSTIGKNIGINPSIYYDFKLIDRYFNKEINCIDSLHITYTLTGKLFNNNNDNYYLVMNNVSEVENIIKCMDDLINKFIKVDNNLVGEFFFANQSFKRKNNTFLINIDKIDNKYVNKNIKIVLRLKFMYVIKFLIKLIPVNITEI